MITVRFMRAMHAGAIGRVEEHGSRRPHELADDMLRGADEISEFIFGARGSRRKVYYLAD
jgi:hypothetical protein